MNPDAEWEMLNTSPGASTTFSRRAARATSAASWPLFLTSARAVIAALLGAALLLALRQTRPVASDIGPLATAVFGMLRGGERPKPAFWLFSVVGGPQVAEVSTRGWIATRRARAESISHARVECVPPDLRERITTFVS